MLYFSRYTIKSFNLKDYKVFVLKTKFPLIYIFKTQPKFNI